MRKFKAGHLEITPIDANFGQAFSPTCIAVNIKERPTMKTRMHRFFTTTVVAAAALLLTVTAAPAAESDLHQQLQAAEDQDDYPAVAEICRRLFEADPGELDALRKLTRTCLALSDTERARRHLGALKGAVGADDPGVLEIEGDLLAREGKNDEAVVKWQAALKANGDNATA